MTKPILIDAATLAGVILRETGKFPQLADAQYVLVSADWLNGEFASSYYDFLQLFDLLDWRPESNDCDKFAGWACAVVRALHARTRLKFSLDPCGLAFGTWFYKPDWSASNHAINWFAYGVPMSETNPEGIAVGWFEPDGRKRHVVSLSEKEINSAFKCEA